MTDTVKASIQIGEKLVIFEGPRDFVLEQVARFTSFAPTSPPEQNSTESIPPRKKRRRDLATGRAIAPNATSCISRILALRDEDFFASQRAMSEIRSALASHGWHYPLTTLSGRLQQLVQQRSLRRERVKDGRKKVWKYSNV